METATAVPYVSTVGMSKEEWLMTRKRGIGASEIGAVLGFSQYTTPYQVWIDKTSRDIIEVLETPAMRRGKMLEQTVADEYVTYTGNQVRKDNKIRIHPTLPFLFASLDRTIVDKGDGRGPGNLECKTVSSFAKKAWEEEIPLSYYAQLQQQLAVTGYTWGEIALLVADTFELTVLPFERDENFIKQMEEIASAFWNTNVIGKVPPPMEVPDFETKFSDKDSLIDATPEVFDLVKKIHDLNEEYKSTGEAIDEAKNAVKKFIGEKTDLTFDGKIIATWRTQSKKEYVVQASQSRVFRLKK